MHEEALEGITQLNRLTDLRLAVTVRSLGVGAAAGGGLAR